MRILDVQEFKEDQYKRFRERRTSQLTRFIDKQVDFVDYYAINRNLSTTTINTHSVDSYIGDDSPVRYNFIKNLPVYGFPVITDVNDYDEAEGGFNSDNWEGTITILPGIIEPSEGDCFVLPALTDKYFFFVTKVENIEMYSKPFYNLSFIAHIPEYLPKLKRQVIEKYVAMFDNIGTKDKVVISMDEYVTRGKYLDTYKGIRDYYLHRFFNRELTVFTANAFMELRNDDIRYTDNFATSFMEKNRIIVMDDLLSDSLMLDYNHMNSDEDYLNYKKSIFYALETKDESKLIPAEYVECKTLNSRFALIYGYGTMEIFCGNKLSITPPNENSFYIKFPYNDIYNKLKNSDYSNDGSVYSKCLSAIVNYIRGQILSPEYFEDMIEHMTGINELILLPMMMYIIKRYIDGLMNVSDNI